MMHNQALKHGVLKREWLARCINSDDEITICVIAVNDGAISISVGFDLHFVLELPEEFLSEFHHAFNEAITVVTQMNNAISSTTQPLKRPHRKRSKENKSMNQYRYIIEYSDEADATLKLMAPVKQREVKKAIEGLALLPPPSGKYAKHVLNGADGERTIELIIVWLLSTSSECSH